MSNDKLYNYQVLKHEKIIVGVVTYNTELIILNKLLTSLMLSDCKITVVLLCNSQDKIYQKSVYSLCEKFKVIFLGDQPNNGFGSGHNTIARSFSSEWYICCNPDVIIQPNTISELIAFGESRQDAVLLMPRVLSSNGKAQPLGRLTLTPLTLFYRQLWRLMPKIVKPFELKFDYFKTQPVDFVSGCFFAVKQSHFWQLGGFDESFFLYVEDADLSYRAKSLGINYFVASSEISHIWQTNTKRNLRSIRLQIRYLFYYFKKHRLWIPFLNFQKTRISQD